MRTPSIRARRFVGAAGVLLCGVALASAPTLAYAGDDASECPGARCGGRIEPICCQRTYWVADPNGRVLENQFYYFPNAM